MRSPMFCLWKAVANCARQAWLAAPGRLITCGHVVERFVSTPALLSVRFPASGKKVSGCQAEFASKLCAPT